MIFTKALPYNDIKRKLDKSDVITIIGCESCVRASGCGGEEKMQELALKLRKDGYNVVDGYMVPSSCTPKLLFAKLGKNINTIISLACSAGLSNIKRYYSNYKIVETTTDIGLMVTDSDQKILKVTMPYQEHKNERGNEYGLCTGEAMDSKKLLIMEAEK
ncbi:hypothetical protein [Caproicibacter fermentans]|uniref:DUF1847 domain-containing protein n=1 Tax=Caproicibacter fermentans TaxID=2576756 RepID=A0A7G8T8H6_9FIRM|nr:hypothetical protein [Caproicibacter fermentans]QNK39917.1 hypothetical protein HCR03_14550 [Caproicibacter fermentans]